MNRMPWIAGIVLALVAGFAIGWSMAKQGDRLTRRESVDTGGVSNPHDVEWAPTLDDMKLERERDDLRRALDSTKSALADAKAELAKKEAAATTPATPAPPSPSQEAARDAARKAIEDLVAKGNAAFASPENHALAEQLGKDLAAAGDLGIALLDEMLASDDSEKRLLAVSYLSYVEIDKALPLYAKALGDRRDDIVRRVASQVLATHLVKKALPDLQKAMSEDKDWGVRANAAYGVAKMGGQGGSEALMACYKDSSRSEAERQAVLGGIADIADPATAPLFRDLLATSKDDSTLYVSIRAVERMKDKASLAALQAIVQNGSNLVREPAKKAYNSIYGQEVYR